MQKTDDFDARGTLANFAQPPKMYIQPPLLLAVHRIGVMLETLQS